jgi:hypothetical protein
MPKLPWRVGRVVKESGVVKEVIFGPFSSMLVALYTK